MLLNTPKPEFSNPTIGRFTKSIDKALPGPHTKQLYDTLSSKDASLLAQLRTGHCKLNEFLFKIRATDSNMCACDRAPETVKHFLLNCSNWTPQRTEMAQALDGPITNLSNLLGGWSGSGTAKDFKPNLKTVKLVISFAKKTHRFDRQEDPD